MIHAMGLLTIGGLLLGSNILGSFIATVFKDVAKGVAKDHLLKAMGRVAQRFQEGKLPKNHDIQGAFREALGQASVALALHLHNPDDRAWHELLENLSDWPKLVARLGQGLQGKIDDEDARSEWLADLVKASKDSDKLQDFPLGKLMEGADLGDWISTEVDLHLAAEVEGEYLAWVARHCPDNGARPPEFERLVCGGWPAARRDQGALTFYQVFALFLISKIKASEPVFRATTLAFHQELKAEMEGIKRGQTPAPDLERLAELVDRFDPEQWQALFDQFESVLLSELKEVARKLGKAAARVDRAAAKLDKAVARVNKASGKLLLPSLAACLVLVLVLVAVVRFGGDLSKLTKQAQSDTTQQKLDSFEKKLEHLTDLAKQFQRNYSSPLSDPSRVLSTEERHNAVVAELQDLQGLTKEQVEQGLKEFSRITRQNPHAKAKDRALADFVDRKFTSAAAQAVAAAKGFEEQFRRDQDKTGESLRHWREMCELGGDAEEAALNHGSALAHYKKALELTPRADSPAEWATLQLKLGRCHWNLGIRVEGGAIHHHLRAAMAAYRAALEVFTRESLPQDWAMTQNNLGVALGDLAGRQKGEEALGSLRAAVAAYRAALAVRTRESLPQDWAATQNSLGAALRDLAGRQEGKDRRELLLQAVEAFEGALQVFTRDQYPHQHAIVSRNLQITRTMLGGSTPAE